MKIFISIKKKWLQNKVYKYTLQYQDALAKSICYSKKSEDYESAAKHSDRRYGSCHPDSIELHEQAADYALKSSYQKNLSDIYLSKKLHLEEEISRLEKGKDVLQFKKDLDF